MARSWAVTAAAKPGEELCRRVRQPPVLGAVLARIAEGGGISVTSVGGLPLVAVVFFGVVAAAAASSAGGARFVAIGMVPRGSRRLV